jgi:hypothetical protein
MQQVYPTDDWPDDLLRALGQLVVAMGQLDYTLDLSLKRAWRLPYQEGMTKAQGPEFYPASSKLKEIRKAIATE